MSIKEMETKARELQELKRMREELDAEIESPGRSWRAPGWTPRP